MRYAMILGLVLCFAFGATAFAEEEPAGEPAGEEAPEAAPAPKRGFADGVFRDDYFGLVYEAPGLAEGFGPGLGGPRVLWSGKADGGVSVEILVREAPEVWTAAEWMRRVKKAWEADQKERKAWEEGAEPRPWVLYVQESLAGFQRQHGHAFYPRGRQCFEIHAQVREKSETSGEAIRSALHGLKVDPEKDDCFFLAHLYASRSEGMDPGDPRVLLTSAFGVPQQGGPGYLGQNPEFKNAHLALRALELAKEKLKGEDLTPDFEWQLHSGIGLAQLTAGKQEEAIPTWQKCVELAKATADPAGLGANSYYNLACAHSLLGQLDEAFEALKACFATGEAEDVSQLKSHAKEDPDLEAMRADERWKAVVGG